MTDWHTSFDARREALKSKGWCKNMWGWYLPHDLVTVGIEHVGLDLEEAEAWQRLLDCEATIKALRSLIILGASDKEIADFVRGSDVICNS